MIFGHSIGLLRIFKYCKLDNIGNFSLNASALVLLIWVNLPLFLLDCDLNVIALN